jgi:hypothetical protein
MVLFVSNGDIISPLDKKLKTDSLPSKEAEMSSTCFILPIFLSTVLIQTVPFQVYVKPEVLSAYVSFRLGLSGKLSAIMSTF